MNIISQYDHVFIGEEGLDISDTVGNFTQIAWSEYGNVNGTPEAVLSVGDPSAFYVAPADFVNRTGIWWRWDGGATRNEVAFNVVDPNIAIMIWDQNANKDVSGDLVPYGNFENFRLATNIYSVTTRSGYSGEGFVNIHMTSPGGMNYTALWQSTTVSLPLTNQVVGSSPWYWVPAGDPTQGWNTGVLDVSGARIYEPGEYIVYAEIDLHNIINNYRAPDGSVYIGKTRTTTNTVTITELPLIKYVELYQGWNLFSTPVVLESGYTKFDEVFSAEEQAKILVLLGWDGSTWYIPSADTDLKPLDAYFIKVKESMTAEAVLVPSESISSPPARYLTEGVNLIGPAQGYDSDLGGFPEMPLNQALICIEQAPGGKTGYIMVISPALNQPGWAYALGGPMYDLLPYDGYWVVMENAGTLCGFSITPIG
ncbi:MAG TPA: DUF3821 domain-containing protein [Methanoregulaceae archaeon]|nr:DUF3821 domain-containing protein [Methanoregulaceae archaeon]